MDCFISKKTFKVIVLAGLTTTVASHFLPAEPLKVGPMRLRPHADLTSTYSDNIFISESNTVDDFWVTFSPGLGMELGTTDEFSLSLDYNTGYSVFLNRNDQDNLSHGLSLTASSVLNKLKLDASLNFNLSNDANTLVGDRVELSGLSGSLGASYQLTEKISAGVTYGKTFNDYVSDQFVSSDSDTVGGNVSFAVTPKTSVYVDGNYTFTDNSLGSDAEGYSTGVGVNGAITSKLSANMRFGYGFREFLPGYNSNESFVASGSLSLKATSKTSMTLGVTRSIDISSTEMNNTFINTSLNYSLTHQFTDKFSGSLFATYVNSDYDLPVLTSAGTMVERGDDMFLGGLNLTYNIQSWLRVYGSYTHRTNYSNIPGLSFDENTVTVGVGASF